MNRVQVILKIIERVEQGGVRSKSQLWKENFINDCTHPLFDALINAGVIIQTEEGLKINSEKASEYKEIFQILG